VNYTIASLVEDLRSCYGARAPGEALGLMIAARNHGMKRERDVFTTAAILLCSPVAACA
jgi:hypothetical protein